MTRGRAPSRPRMLLLVIGLTGCVDIPDPTATVDRGADMPIGDRGAADVDPGEADTRPPADAALDMRPAFDMAPALDMAPPRDGSPERDVAPIPDVAPPIDMAPDPDLMPTPDMAPPRGELRIELVERPGEEPLLLEPVPVDGASRNQVVLSNVGQVPLTILPDFRIEPGRRAQAFSIDGPREAVELEPGESRVTVLTFAPVEPGPASAGLLIQSNDRVTHRVAIGAVAYHDVHVVLGAGGADADIASVSHGTYTGGAAWDARALPATLGRFVDVACGGVCRSHLDPAGPSDAGCVAVGEQDGIGTILTTDDGQRWLEAEINGRPPPFLGVDYGPPWYAVTSQRTLWTSEDGLSWEQSVQFEEQRGLPRDLAVDADGQVFIVGSGGARWWVPERDDAALIIGETLGRVVDGPGGDFVAVGEGGRWLYVDPAGDTTTGTFVGARSMTDAAVGFAPGEAGWTVVGEQQLYRTRRGNQWPVAAASALQRVAVGEVYALGVGGGTVYRFEPVNSTYGPLPNSPPWAMVLAAGRVCPDNP